MTLERFRGLFSIEKWFLSWRAELDSEIRKENVKWDFSLRRSILEALSDASAEQFLNPIVASHLRHFGRQLARKHSPNRCFWVRSEWDKVDISYGLAERFNSASRWDKGWLDGTTGDLGQIEAKVCYAHLHRGRIKKLADQLKARRKYDRKLKAPLFANQRYHGLVWLFQHGGLDRLAGVGSELTGLAGKLGLCVVRGFEVPTATDHLGPIWPTVDQSSYQCGMATALFELEQ